MSIQAQGAPGGPASLRSEEKRRELPQELVGFGAVQARSFVTHPAWATVDLLVVLVVSSASLWPALAGSVDSSRLLLLAASYASLVLLALKSCALYEEESADDLSRECMGVCKAVALSSVLFLFALTATQYQAVAPRAVAVMAAANAMALSGWRAGARSLRWRRTARGRAVRHALIVGGGQLGRSLALAMERNRSLGIAVRGFLDDRGELSQRLGGLGDLVDTARAEFIDEIYITLPLYRPGVMELIQQARERHISVKIVPALLEGQGTLPVHYIGMHPAFTLHEEPVRGMAKLCKRLADIVGSVILLVCAAPLMIAIAIAIKLDSEGPVFYCADRAGFKGRRFRFYKFRTMVSNADELKEELRQLNERRGPFFKITNDPRMTRVGRFLRATSLDELPQLFHVLTGEMSLVGPRPHPVDDYRQYSLEHLRRLDVLPGITGLWQVTARADPSFERNMELDLYYIEHWSFWLDMKILAKTLPAVLRKEGV